MPKLLIDANISYRIKKKLSRFYKDVLHTTDINLSQPAKDGEIWNWAQVNNYIIVTYDTDFEKLLNQNGFPPKLILIKIGNQPTHLIAEMLIVAYEKLIKFEVSLSEGLLEFI